MTADNQITREYNRHPGRLPGLKKVRFCFPLERFAFKAVLWLQNVINRISIVSPVAFAGDPVCVYYVSNI